MINKMRHFDKTIHIDGNKPTHIHYKYYGPSQTDAIDPTIATLIWLDGGPGFDLQAHEPFISTLANDHLQVIMLDQRGHG